MVSELWSRTGGTSFVTNLVSQLENFLLKISRVDSPHPLHKHAILFLMVEAVIFDYGRTLYDPEVDNLFPGTIETLEWLQQNEIKMGLVSVALTDDVTERISDLDRFNLKRFFDAIDIIARSHEKDFALILEKLGVEPERCVVIGDNLKREITVGNMMGAYTVWTKERLSADWQPDGDIQTPKATIHKIEELIEILKNHLE